MSCENENVKNENEEPEQQLREKIEPNLPKILQEFSELLERKYGLSEFSVVSFKLQPGLSPIEPPEGMRAAVKICTYDCDSGTCERIC